MTLLTLPYELVERILLLLAPESVQTCQLVNRSLNEIIQSSTLLRYLQACQAAGVIDNLQSPISYAERLEALKKREEAWRKINPVFEMTISPNRRRICHSIEGVFFLSADNEKDLNYCHLPSFPQDKLRWAKIPGHGPALNWSGILINSISALYEHDLIVTFISSNIGNQADMQRHSLDMVLLKFSTGEYHPLARRPRIHIQRSPEVEPLVVSRIVGDNLALVVHSDDGTFSDKLVIFEWKTGRKRLQHDVGEYAYSGLVFVSPEFLLVPNCVLSHFEVWYLPPSQLNLKSPVQILSLKIPAVSPEYSLRNLHCYGEPNPFLHSRPYLPSRSFFSSSENSIIMAALRMLSNSGRRTSYNLIMHRRSLHDAIQTWTSPSLLEQQKHLPTWLTNEVTVHEIPDPEDGSIQPDAQSKLVSTVPHPRFSPQTRDSPTSGTSGTFPISRISADSRSSSVSSGLSRNSSTYTFMQVPWKKWGPSISRWFQVNGTHVTRSYGKRYAFSNANPLDGRKLTVSIVDFNPHDFKRNAETTARVGSREGENNRNNEDGQEEEKKEGFEKLDHKGVFSEEVYMGLKCLVYRAPDDYDFDLVLMEEERLFGVKLDRQGWEESIKVFYIG